MDQKMNSGNKIPATLEDVKINVKVVLAALWVSHFLLWTFGDMVSLLQILNDPVANELLLLVAVPLATIQVIMIIYSLAGKAEAIRWANICISLAFMLFNIGFVAEAKFGWEFLLGSVYILVNILIILYAWKWPKVEDQKAGGI